MDLSTLFTRADSLNIATAEYRNEIDTTKKKLDEMTKTTAELFAKAIKEKHGKTIDEAYQDAKGSLSEEDKKSIDKMLDELEHSGGGETSADILKSFFIWTAVDFAPAGAWLIFGKAASYYQLQALMLRDGEAAMHALQADMGLAAFAGAENPALEMELAAQAVRGYEAAALPPGAAAQANRYTALAEKFATAAKWARRVTLVFIPITIGVGIAAYFIKKHEEEVQAQKIEEAKVHLKESIRLLCSARLYTKFELDYLNKLTFQSGRFYDVASGMAGGHDVSWIVDSIVEDAKKLEIQCSLQNTLEELQKNDKNASPSARTDADLTKLDDMMKIHREQLKKVADEAIAKANAGKKQ